MSKPSRGRREGEISEVATRTQESLNKKLRDLRNERDDVLVTRETLDQLEWNGTEEGAQEVMDAIRRAEEGSKGIFNQDGCVLEDIHRDGQEQESDLQEGRNSVERDIRCIIDASGRINVRENVRDLEHARERATQDKDFLERHIALLDDAIARSQADYEDLKSQVQMQGGTSR